MKVEFQQAMIEGFRGVVKQLIFDLDRPGLNLVKGVNGAGKTTVFEAVVWCLFGINLKDTNQDAVASWEEIRQSDWKGTRVMVTFNIDGDTYSIIRHLSYKGETNGIRGNDTLMLWDADELYPGINKDETQEKINKLLGTDPKTFMNSVMFGQRMARLITQDNKDKRQLFEQLFDVEWVNAIKRKAELDLTEKSQVLSQTVYETDQLISKVAMAEEALRREKRLLEEWKGNQDNKILNCEANIKGFQTIINNCNAELKEAPSIPYDKEEHDKIEKEYNELTNAKSKWQLEIFKIENEADNTQITIDNDYRETTKLQGNKERLQKLIDVSKDVVKEAAVKGLCPTCHQAIKKTHQADIEKAYSTVDKVAEIVAIDAKIKELGDRLPHLIATLDLQLGQIKRTKEIAAEKDDRHAVVAARYQELNDTENELFELNNRLRVVNNKIESTGALLANEKNRLKELQDEKPPDIDLKAQQDMIDSKIVQLGILQGAIEDLQNEIKIIKWWSEKGFGAGGVKAFIFNAMLAQLNENTRKYGERLGVSLEFSIDLTKASKPFTTICSLGNKLNKDYREFSGGEKQRLDIVLIFAMYDLISINSDINLLIMDEVFEGLDEDGENAVFDLIRMKADEGKSVYVITHSPVLDSLYANTIYFENKNNTTLILN